MDDEEYELLMAVARATRALLLHQPAKSREIREAIKDLNRALAEDQE